MSSSGLEVKDAKALPCRLGDRLLDPFLMTSTACLRSVSFLGASVLLALGTAPACSSGTSGGALPDGATLEPDAPAVEKDSGTEPPGCETTTPCTSSAQCVALAGTSCNTNSNKCQKVLCASKGDGCSEDDHCKSGSVCVDGACGEPAGGDYFAICLPNVSTGDPAKSLRFAATVTRSGDSLAMSLQPLPKTAVSLATKVGTKFPAAPATGKITSGKAVLSVGDVVIPASANGVTGSDVIVTGLTAQAYLTAAPDFCATIEGTINPPGVPLTPGDAVCLFKRVASTSTTVTIPSLPNFSCP